MTSPKLDGPASRARDERPKAEIALAILEANDVALSVQVLQEFYVQATRPTLSGRLTHDQAALLVESWLRFPVQAVTVPVVQTSLRTAARFRISYWDAAIVESARAVGCSVVLSEDLTHGQSFAGVTVQDPFTAGATKGAARPPRRRA